jgi:hypothetical protein
MAEGQGQWQGEEQAESGAGAGRAAGDEEPERGLGQRVSPESEYREYSETSRRPLMPRS